ncbi:MAG TPA: hypothetical protein VN619_03970 [Lacisediminihabitans sp.]|jgi:hypothetical protein|nr:hypothetical protein [Lacisediminihabitans sp.]HXD61066.1 hypothetical protein [Lacisediminihabitans sp.]
MVDYEFAGLPLHVLLVHLTVIVVPVAALATVLAAAWPAARRRLGVVTPIIALVALIAVPITVEAGEWLEERVGATPLVAAHAALGKTLLPWAVAVFIVALAQWAWFRFGSPRMPARVTRLTVTIVLAAAVAVTAVGSVLTVVQIGESGARAVWTGSFQQNPR